jgi:SAM-dependent methyltransferase
MTTTKQQLKSVMGGRAITQIKQLKSAGKRGAGNILLQLLPHRAQAIAQENFTLVNYADGTRRGIIDRLMREAIAHNALSQPDQTQLSQLHQDYWRGEQGALYHDQHRDKFEFVWGKFAFILDDLKQLLAQNPQITTLCEIGTGSGQLLDHLAHRLPQIEEFIGIDLSPDTIEANRQQYNHPKLTFLADDAKAWIEQNAQPHWVYVTFRGVLEYFTEADLRALLRSIAHEQKPAIFLAIEPVARDHDLTTEPNSRLYGDEFSFSHNYPHLFQSAGFQVVHASHQTLYYHKEHLTLATVGLV